MIDRSTIGLAAAWLVTLLTPPSRATQDSPLVIEVAPEARGAAVTLTEAVAKANAASKRAVELRLAPGTYVVREGLSFAPDLASLSIVAVGPGVRLVGAVEAQAPRWEPLAGPHAARVPEKAQAWVSQWRLPPRSLEGWKGGLSGPVHSGHSVTVEADRSELFVGGRALTLARWPDGGFTPVGKLVDAGSVPRNQADDVPVEKRSKEPARGGAFIPADTARTARWAGASDAWVHGYWNWDWSDELLPIASIDKEKGLITLAQPHRYGLAARGRFAIVNLPEELDAPGEYWIDREEGVVCAWLTSGSRTLTAQVSMLAEPMLTFKGSSHDVTLRGVRFEASRGGAIVASDVRNFIVESCEFVNIGATAVTLEGRDCAVRRCWFTDVGGIGLSLGGGDRVTLKPGNNVVEECSFRNCGRLQRTYNPAVLLAGVGNRVLHNEIAELPHIALMFSGNDHLIEANEIHHVVLETGDAGAVYTGRDWTAQGTIIRGNYFHDIRGTDARYQNAVYLDDMASGLLVEQNLFAECNWGILAGGGRDLTLRDNAFIACGKALSFDARGTGWMAPNIADASTSTLIRAFHAMPVSLEPWASRYPKLASYLVDQFGKPVRGRVLGNHLVNTPLGTIEDRRNVDERGTTKATIEKNAVKSRLAELAVAVRHGEITVGAATLGPVGPHAANASDDAWRIDPDRAALTALREASPVWTTPGLTAAGSMPIGNGRLGANAWVEASGDLVLLLSHTDSFSECERLLKLARVRLACEPPLDPSKEFSQYLDLEAGMLRIRAGDGEFDVLPDAASDVMLVRMTSKTPRRLTVKLEVWRNATREIAGREQLSTWLMHESPPGVSVPESADAVVNLPDALAWYHRNETSAVAFTLEHQGLGKIAAKFPDPLLHRTFGARIDGEGLVKVDSTTLRAAQPASESVVRIVAACSQADSAKAWLASLSADATKAPGWPAAEARTRAAWTSRWNRSFVFVEPAAPATPLDNPHPLRVGIDSAGGNRFDGHIAGAVALAKAMPEAELAQVAMGPAMLGTGGECLEAGEVRHAGAFTFVAWIRPERPGVTGRIIDKVTAGRGDGALLDLQNGKLRAVVGDQTVQTEAEPQPAQITCVALIYDSAVGEPRLYVAGKLVQGRSSSPRRVPTSVSRAYALQRYVTAAAARGEFPVKFNGSIFTVPPVHVNGGAYDDDFRNWGGSYWWQNTRLPYHGMLARGDDDLLESLLAFYERVTPGCVARAKLYYGADGVYFPETMTTFGTYANADYGWNRESMQPSDVACAYWRYAWNQGPELVAMMLDRWDYGQDRRELESRTLPMATQVLGYFDTRFSRDVSGKLVIDPTQAIETYWTGVVNDLPTVAGLRDVTARLCALPADVGTRSQRALFARMRAACPELPTRSEAGAPPRFAPAEKFNPQRSNCENPELMAVWPFSLSGVGRGLLEEGRASYAARIEKMTHGWTQDGQQAARLGLADQAAANLLSKVRNTHPNFRFPAFWGPNFDWLPDQCHGGNLLTTAQEMLLQSVGDRILICPALPKDWSGHFRLRAARNTTVTASVCGGVVEWITVDPPERLRDVVAGDGWSIRGR